MKNKRASLISLLLLLISLVCIVSVFAHPGRTDSNGGHWDRQSGTYHFHTGEYAGKGSSGNSSNSDYVPFKPPYEPPTDNPYRTDNSNSKSNSVSTDFWDYAGITIFVLIFGGPIVVHITEFVYDVFLSDHMPKHKISRLIDKISEYHRLQKEILDIRSDLLDLNLTMKIPVSYEIGKDNLPRDKSSGSNWGNSFTMYKTTKGKKLHPKYNCCFATEPVHICWYRNRCDFSDILCGKCACSYTLPDLSWYNKYMDCQKLKKSQSYNESRCRDLRKEIEILHKKCNSTTAKILIVFSKKNRSALHEANALYSKMQSKYRKGDVIYERKRT